jgi:hypothetical protein
MQAALGGDKRLSAYLANGSNTQRKTLRNILQIASTCQGGLQGFASANEPVLKLKMIDISLRFR